jgi:hypothetical protein
MKEKWKYPSHNPDLNRLRFEDNHKQNVLMKIKSLKHSNGKNRNEQKSFGMRKVGGALVAAATIIVFLLGSTYLSPAWAKVASHIPYFNQIIQNQEYTMAVNDTVWNVIQENKYPISQLDVNIPDKNIDFAIIGTEQEVNSMKKEVMTKIDAALQAKDLGKFSIQVRAGKERLDEFATNPELVKNEKESQALHDEIMKQLKLNHYEPAFPIQVRVNFPDNFIYVAVPNTESKQRMDDLKALLKTASSKYGDDFKMRITRIDMKAREQELRWGNTIMIIGDVLMQNEEFKTTGYSFSFHPYPLQLKIKTSIQSSDPDAKEKAERIENAIAEFIQTHEKTKDIRNDPYELTILSKDKKKLN